MHFAPNSGVSYFCNQGTLTDVVNSQFLEIGISFVPLSQEAKHPLQFTDSTIAFLNRFFASRDIFLSHHNEFRQPIISLRHN